MKMTIGALTGLLLLAMTAGSAVAEPDGDDYTFTLYNASSQTVLTFQTARTNGSWSNDWIPTRVLEENDQVNMRFFDSEEECEYNTKVTMADGTEYYETIDYCEIEDVYVTDNGFYAE